MNLNTGLSGMINFIMGIITWIIDFFINKHLFYTLIVAGIIYAIYYYKTTKEEEDDFKSFWLRFTITQWRKIK